MEQKIALRRKEHKLYEFNIGKRRLPLGMPFFAKKKLEKAFILDIV